MIEEDTRSVEDVEENVVKDIVNDGEDIKNSLDDYISYYNLK